MLSAVKMLKNRMVQVGRIKALDKSLDTQDAPPVNGVEGVVGEWPFSALGPFLTNGEPAPNGIVLGQGTNGKGTPANVAYRKKISNNTSKK